MTNQCYIRSAVHNRESTRYSPVSKTWLNRKARMNGWGVKGTRNNFFYKKLLTSPKGLSTGLPDMVVPHRYVLISDQLEFG